MAKEKKKSLLPKSTLIIRLIAGMYLLYLSYELFMGLNAPEGAPTGVSIGVAVFFIICGFILVIVSGRDFIKGKYEGGKMDISQSKEE